jgi:hypothetical protein
MNHLWKKKLKSKEDSLELGELLKTEGTKRIFKVLEEILDERLDTLTNVKRSDYDNASWAYEQAHCNGEIRAYRETIKLLKQKE